ncbi:MAG: (Fe-S)-binding protein [Candidatus Gastranaerophilales bacterium]|nr:(Fe-S)-binding protein [Candidatus Gastranaerophilales bacterium]
MKELKDYKEEIHRCSKCGLCQAVCPIYRLTGNECTVSRGQFIMLDGIVKQQLKMNKNINKYLDLCLKCGKCTNFCPSEIDVIDILLAAKHIYFKNSIQGKLYSFFESKFIFNNLLKIVSTICTIFHKKKKSKQYPKKAVYFGGCISKLRPDIDNYIVELLNKMEIETISVNFDCCGMPFLTTGNLERFSEQAIENLSKLDFDFDYFVTDCASCQWAWKQYAKYIDDEQLKSKLSKVNFKSIYDLIIEKDIKFTSEHQKTVTYHKPCHEHGEIELILNNCENIQYHRMGGYDECCGFAGYEQPHTLKTVSKLMSQKRENIKNTKAETLLTTCAGCLISLNIQALFTGVKAQRLISFLKNNCFIK